MTAALTVVGWLDLVAAIVLAGGPLHAGLVGEPSPAGRRMLGRAALALAIVLPLEFGLTAFRMYGKAVVGLSERFPSRRRPGVPCSADRSAAIWTKFAFGPAGATYSLADAADRLGLDVTVVRKFHGLQVDPAA